MCKGLPWWLSGKESACDARDSWETLVQFLIWEDNLEQEMATHFSILAWELPYAEESGGHSPRGHQEPDTTE